MTFKDDARIAEVLKWRQIASVNVQKISFQAVSKVHNLHSLALTGVS